MKNRIGFAMKNWKKFNFKFNYFHKKQHKKMFVKMFVKMFTFLKKNDIIKKIKFIKRGRK